MYLSTAVHCIKGSAAGMEGTKRVAHNDAGQLGLATDAVLYLGRRSRIPLAELTRRVRQLPACRKVSVCRPQRLDPCHTPAGLFPTLPTVRYRALDKGGSGAQSGDPETYLLGENSRELRAVHPPLVLRIRHGRARDLHHRSR